MAAVLVLLFAVLFPILGSSASGFSSGLEDSAQGCLLQASPDQVILKASPDHVQDNAKQWLPAGDGKVHFRALVDSMCPASMSFLKHQFIPLMKDPEARQVLDIDLYAFTNAAKDPSGTVTCQHGEHECSMNMLLTCAKAELDSPSFVDFVECALPKFLTSDVPYLTSVCLGAEVTHSVNACVHSDAGTVLRQQAMDWFPESREYSPWVLMSIDNGALLTHSTEAENGIQGLMCQFASKKPSSCYSAALISTPTPCVKPSPRFPQPSAFVQDVPEATGDRLKLRVFFEALCPASQQFIARQVLPLVESGDLAKLVDVDVWPYSNAVVTSGNELTCQHGEFECLGNQRIVCAKKVLSSPEFFKFLECFEPIPASQHVVSKASGCLGTAAQDVEDCAADETRAKALRLEAYSKMPANRQYCPWVTLNGEHSDLAEHRLKKTVCSMLSEDELPATCHNA